MVGRCGRAEDEGTELIIQHFVINLLGNHTKCTKEKTDKPQNGGDKKPQYRSNNNALSP